MADHNINVVFFIPRFNPSWNKNCAAIILAPTWLLLDNCKIGVFRVSSQSLVIFLFVTVTSESSKLEKVGGIFLQVSLLLILENG